jgi:hypothetical protein
MSWCEARQPRPLGAARRTGGCLIAAVWCEQDRGDDPDLAILRCGEPGITPEDLVTFSLVPTGA